MSSDVTSVNLTAGQYLRLLLGCIPCVSLLTLVALYLVVTVDVLGEGLPPIGLWAVVSMAATFTGWDALNCLRDIASGVALVTEDRAEHTTNSRRPGRWGYSARFARLGRMRVSSATYSRLALSVDHRLIYSPASKHLWAAEALTRGSGTWFRSPRPGAETRHGPRLSSGF